jgi:hypothetical protein
VRCLQHDQELQGRCSHDEGHGQGEECCMDNGILTMRGRNEGQLSDAAILCAALLLLSVLKCYVQQRLGFQHCVNGYSLFSICSCDRW